MTLSGHAWIQQVRNAVWLAFGLEPDERTYLLSLLDSELGRDSKWVDVRVQVPNDDQPVYVRGIWIDGVQSAKYNWQSGFFYAPGGEVLLYPDEWRPLTVSELLTEAAVNSTRALGEQAATVPGAECLVPGASLLDGPFTFSETTGCDTENLPPIPDEVADQLAHEVDASGTPFLDATVNVPSRLGGEVRVWLMLEELYTSWIEATVKIPEGREISVMLINGNDIHIYTREKEADGRERPTESPDSYECREVRFGHATDETQQGAKE